MNKKTLKTIATGAAITLATVGASTVSADTQYGIFLNRVTGEWQTVNHATGEIVKSEPNGTYSSYEEAQASLATSTVETPKTSADVQPALDAQQAVVDATAAEASQAQADADAANQTVTTAQAEVDTATQAVKDAEANAVNATPENIAANQADQAANLADQEANATETDQVNAEIVAQTQTVADAQTAVDTAQAEKDQADATVTAKEADVKAAQDAISGTGLAEAQANLDNASEAVTDAKANVDTATQAVEDAKKADADRDAKIKAAETEVAVKSDAVKTATDALANVDVVTVNVDSNFKSDLDNWKANPSEDNADFLKDSGFNSISASTLKVGTNDAKSAIDVNNLTKDNQLDMSFIYVDAVNQLRKQLGLQTVATVTDNAITIAQNRANQYKQRGTDPVTTGHIPGAIENLARLGSIDTLKTVEDIKNAAWQAFLATSFDDSKSNWNHLTPNMYANGGIGLSITNINGQYWLVAVLANDGTPITNPNDPATLQAALAKAQADQSAAQAASDTAQANLVKASSDYAKALELKTQAEKTLADATATPLQTQVAENNLRLAEIALQNAEARKADAQKAVDNFSASLAEKKAALDAAKTELAKQQGTLDSLNKDKDALLAEKDRLVEEAKALAEELQGYLKAPAILANAQATLTEKQADLTDAQAKAETAQNKLETVTAKLAEEKAKLAELQAEYNKLKDIEDKAKDNVIATLPDGTIVAVPKDAPTAVEKPAINIDAVKDAITKGQDVTVVDGKVVVTESQAGVTITQTATGEKVTYSRAERAKALPNTGEQTSLLALAGVAVLSSLGLTGARRKRRG
ncbi:TPA: SEC10/PgrA surface exclusion domain-containing protein [Streptococcus suis]|nr:SEC10/PgrA surface exclusion domain-containing protein [Streptococcus suis]HEM4938775.1 SEC10/PgrA surface exclusion domain-containing protein [Streptococcus suis]HEM5009638.1 SEC10/PgrA surface exclusion domain-containing protein [Streptococcus suis]HEM5072164.1 SEC10/PgrA surface exclusion domain-containing protein [Streptococcus suis]HEM5262652.1 SEC10/PgrA surface exclusion domain-containing protein [Streptococcus suis]